MPIISKERLVELRAILDPRTPEATIKGAEYIINHLVVKRAKRYDVTLAFSQWTILNYTNFLLSKNAYAEAATLLWGKELFTVEPASVRMIWEELPKNCEVAIMGAGSMGKSIMRGTKVIRYDGTIDVIENIKVGDLLMGDDSKPRKVLNTHRGRSIMYRITPQNGDTWVCNKHHILSLKCTMDKKNGDGKTVSSNYRRGKVIDIPIEEYLKKSNQFKEHYRQFRIPVDWNEKAVPFDPYCYGAWIADGTKVRLEITKPECEMVGRWRSKLTELGCIVAGKTKSGDCYSWRVVGGNQEIMGFLSSTICDNQKRIDRRYLINSRKIRMELLAGILDGDGYVQGPGFELLTKYEELSEDVEFLCRSLGLAVSRKPVTKGIKSTGFSGKYWKLWISGNCSEIPTLDKKAPTWKSNRDWLTESFTVEELPEDDYYGIALDGNHRYLLGDFTVTHNSYSVGVWLLLDWIRDPEHTCIKVLSVTEEHAKRNVFAHIKNLHRNAIVPLPGVAQERSIQVGNDDKQGVHLVRIPAGEDGKGRLRGFHPVPRGTIHPQFGSLTRIRVILDEAEEIPQGVWEDVDNILGNKDGVETIKVIAASNPKDVNSKFGQLCEPVGGWDGENMDFSERWSSRLGWRTLHIDGSKCENVIEKKLIYPGLLTWEGYSKYLLLPEGSPSFYTMARGWFPIKGLHATVFPLDLINRLKGEFIFTGRTVFCAASDLAFEGDDKATFAVGRCGMAIGWTPPGKASVLFTQQKFVLQIEQIISMAKKRSLEMTHDIIAKCEMFNIKPRWFICDRTGNGTGVHDNLVTLFGPETMGLHYGDGATETKILEDELEKACDNYDGVVTELFFALRKWAEFDHVKIVPNICTPELTHEFTDRRYKQGKLKKVRIESKRDYKDRNGGVSPDCFIAGTKISTPSGLVSIEDIKIGDRVVTPMGDQVVSYIHISRSSKLVAARFSNGSVLIGKGSHKIFTWDKGWVRLDALSFDNEIESISNIGLWKFLNSYYTRVKSSGFKQQVDTITRGGRMRLSDLYIGAFGLIVMERSLRSITFIIRMVTGLTIGSRIWNYFKKAFISVSTLRRNIKTRSTKCVTQNSSTAFGIWPLNGTDQQLGLNGTSTMERILGSEEVKLSANAKNVDRNLRRGLKIHQFVQSLARIKYLSKGIKKFASALNAVRNLVLLNIGRPSVAVESVVFQESGETVVYNLTLENENAY